MADDYSLTIQISYNTLYPWSPGHVALVLNTPYEQQA